MPAQMLAQMSYAEILEAELLVRPPGRCPTCQGQGHSLARECPACLGGGRLPRRFLQRRMRILRGMGYRRDGYREARDRLLDCLPQHGEAA